MPGGGPVMRRPTSLDLPPPGQQQTPAIEDEESEDGASEGPRNVNQGTLVCFVKDFITRNLA